LSQCVAAAGVVERCVATHIMGMSVGREASTVQGQGRETSLRELRALIMSGHVHGNG